jgi:Protein of unknown function (DUF2934)
MTPPPTKDQKTTRNKASLQPYQEATGHHGQVTQDKIAEIAYYKSESSGFTPGHELNDWLEAEQELSLSCEDRGQPNIYPSHPTLDTAIG